jgi:hypothetical protein
MKWWRVNPRGTAGGRGLGLITACTQAAGQAQVVDQHAGDHVDRVPDHLVAADLDSNTFRPIRSSLHLIGAILDRILERQQTSIIVEAMHLSRSRHTSHRMA